MTTATTTTPPPRTFSALPVLPLSHALDPSTKPAFLDDLRHALLNVGFLYLSETGLPDGLISDVIRECRAFFKELPQGEKERIEMKNEKSFLGWSRVSFFETKVFFLPMRFCSLICGIEKKKYEDGLYIIMVYVSIFVHVCKALRRMQCGNMSTGEGEKKLGKMRKGHGKWDIASAKTPICSRVSSHDVERRKAKISACNLPLQLPPPLTEKTDNCLTARQ